jgi:hypothetical protein
MLQVHWRAGDPTPLGWAATLAYLFAAIACAVVAGRLRHARSDLAVERRLWFALAALLLFFGINKQADLQTVLVHYGRQGAQALGILDYRRHVHAAFFVFALCVTLALGWRLRHSLRAFARSHGAAALGVGAIALYIFIRFAAIAHVEPDALVSPEDPVRFGFLEILGNGLVGYAAVKAAAAGSAR